MNNSPRFQFPRWRDPRVFIGAFLVVASIAGTWFVVDRVAQTVTVWAASAALVPGATISADHVVAVEVKLPSDTHGYVPTEAATPVGATVQTPVSAGELIPHSALISPADLEGRVVSLEVHGSVPAGVDSGERVDIWAADPDAEEPDPTLIVEQAPVLSVTRDAGGFTASTHVKIEVYVAPGQLESVMRAQAAGHHISVVAIPGQAS